MEIKEFKKKLLVQTGKQYLLLGGNLIHVMFKTCSLLVCVEMKSVNSSLQCVCVRAVAT